MNNDRRIVTYVNWKRKQFEELPYRKWDEIIKCSSLVLLPQRKKHDSSFALINCAAIGLDDKPKCLVSGCSDVIHFDGISGFGENWVQKYGKCPDLVPPIPWSIDCLYPSGLFRIFVPNHIIKIGPALSSLEIYAI